MKRIKFGFATFFSYHVSLLFIISLFRSLNFASQRFLNESVDIDEGHWINFYDKHKISKKIISHFKFPISFFPFPIPLSHLFIPTPHSPFPIPYSLFPIPYSLFPIFHSLFPISYSLFLIRYSLFPIRHTLFPIPRFPFPIPHSLFSFLFPFSVSYSPLSISHSSFLTFHLSIAPLASMLIQISCPWKLKVYFSLRLWIAILISEITCKLKNSLDAILSYVSLVSPMCRRYEIITMLRVRNLSKIEVWRQANLSCSLMKKCVMMRRPHLLRYFWKEILSF